jgi:hypothetical protein
MLLDSGALPIPIQLNSRLYEVRLLLLASLARLGAFLLPPVAGLLTWESSGETAEAGTAWEAIDMATSDKADNCQHQSCCDFFN